MANQTDTVCLENEKGGEMRTHRSTWDKADKRKAHELKQNVKLEFQALTHHCFDQYAAKAQASRTALCAAKYVLRHGLVIETHTENKWNELRVVVRHGSDVFTFNLRGWAVTYWHNDENDNHSTLRNQFTHDHLVNALTGQKGGR